MKVNSKSKFYMLVGLPGSGKSSIAMKMIDEAEANQKPVWISSDCIRKEIFGDESVQEESHKVFDIMCSRTLDALKSGKDVIYDACNISSKHRRAFLQNLKKLDCEKICVVVATPYNTCLGRNASRCRVVPVEVIDRMYKTWMTPAYFEGWDSIKIAFADGAKGVFGDAQNFAMKYQDYDQMNPFHKESLGNHLVNTWESVKAAGYDAASNIALAALLHDCGKPFTREERRGEEGKAIAHYYQHNCTGAYDSLFFAYTGKTDEDILEISLMINLHMTPFSWASVGGTNNRMLNLWGTKLYKSVLLIHEADRTASVSMSKCSVDSCIACEEDKKEK